MYNRIAKYIVCFLDRHKVVDENKSEICTYGLEIMIAYICYFGVLLILATITNTLIESLLFFTSFVLLRRYAGGFHASSYRKCHLIFAINQLLFIMLIKFLNVTEAVWLATVILLISTVIVFVYAPIDNINRRFSNNEYKYFKKSSRICASIILLIVVVWIYLFGMGKSVFSIVFGYFSASFSIILGKIQNVRSKFKNNEEVDNV